MRISTKDSSRMGEENTHFSSLNSPLEFLLMSKKDRGSLPFAPSAAYELQMHACYFQSQRIQMSLNDIKCWWSAPVYWSFFNLRSTPKKSIWRLSMKRRNNCNESCSSHITKTRCRAQIIPSIMSPDNWFRRSCRTSGKSKNIPTWCFLLTWY